MSTRSQSRRRLFAEALEERRVLTGFPLSIGSGEGYDITTDASGSIYFAFSNTGFTDEEVDFDPGPGAANFDGAFVAKYSSDGDFLWARGVQGTTTTGKGKKGGGGTTTNAVSGRAAGVAADSAGNLYVMSYIVGNGTIAGVNAGNVPYTTSVAVGSSQPRLLIAKFDTLGNLQWNHEYSDASAKGAYWGGIAIHEINGVTDGVFIGNSFTGTVDFDPSIGSAELTSAGSADIYVLKLDAAGDYQWAIRGGSTADDFASAISVAPNGTVYATGGFNGQNPFGSSFPVASYGGQDGWVAEIDGANGTVSWVRGFGGVGLDAGREVEARNNYVTVAGNFEAGSDAMFGSEALQSNGQLDAFASKLDSNGNFLWTRSYGGAGNEHGWGLAVDASDNVFVGGPFYLSVDFDGGPGAQVLTSPGDNADAFVVSVDDQGQFNWATQLTGAGVNSMRDLTWSSYNNSILVGGGLYGNTGDNTTQAANLSGPIGPVLSGFGASIFELNAVSGLPPGFEPNDPPLADARVAQSGNEDQSVTFDASGSSDPENDPLTYLWDFGDGQTAQTTSPTVNHTYAFGGAFTVTLTVLDGHGNQSVDTTSATIVEVNDVPVANIGNGYAGYESQPVHFDASASVDFDNVDDTSVNDQVLTYYWDFGDGNSATTNFAAVDHVYAEAGSYQASLVINDGLVSSLASLTTVAITVAPVDNSNKLYVYDIRFDSRKGGKEWQAVFEIRRDSDANSNSGDAVVAGVTIEVRFAGVTFTGATDSNGVFRTTWRSLAKGTYEAEVVSLEHSVFNWSLYDNVNDLEDDSDGDGLPDAFLAF